MDACTEMIINYSSTPAELLETEQPLRVDRYAFVPDSGGAGHYRGGLAMERHLRVLADEAILQIRSDRRDVLPYGLEGGSSGAPSSVSILRADGEEREYPAKFLTNVTKDDVLKVRLAGGGGYGDPRLQPSKAVLEDVIHEEVSPAGAARDYGVAVRGTPPRIDADETLLLPKGGRT